ncbi:hypothetical protein [Streptomyces sp. G-G2]|uniref:hypothetical protein n=1 Tax=Streptomyces sp. G-G2 TaxID=3046201 RepID=UPI0024BA1D0D|nr:hypothetical protein [Streptomyces sp. G-G2]MDJ0382019.1 hypothetical protein [Streptomyces sp. G-G2]
MRETGRIALAAAYRLAAPPLTGVLMERLPEETADLPRHGHGLPNRLTDAVIARGDHTTLKALAGNDGHGPHLRAAQVRLARLGDPDIGRVLYKAGSWDGADEVRAAVLAAADQDDPGWRAEGGLVNEVLAASRRRPAVLKPPLGTPFFPELVAVALFHLPHRDGPQSRPRRAPLAPAVPRGVGPGPRTPRRRSRGMGATALRLLPEFTGPLPALLASASGGRRSAVGGRRSAVTFVSVRGDIPH